MEPQKLGAFIQSRRKALGMTQSELAKKLNVTDKAVSRWERGVGFPDIKLLEPLAKGLELSAAELLRCEQPAAEKKSVGYRSILAVCCFLLCSAFWVVSQIPQLAAQTDWLSPVNKLLFLVMVGIFLFAAYREDSDENG